MKPLDRPRSTGDTTVNTIILSFLHKSVHSSAFVLVLLPLLSVCTPICVYNRVVEGWEGGGSINLQPVALCWVINHHFTQGLSRTDGGDKLAFDGVRQAWRFLIRGPASGAENTCSGYRCTPQHMVALFCPIPPSLPTSYLPFSFYTIADTHSCTLFDSLLFVLSFSTASSSHTRCSAKVKE